MISSTFEYGTSRVRNVVVNSSKTETSKTRKHQRTTVHSVEIDGRPCVPTKRFWKTLEQQFRFKRDNMFHLFSPAEVLTRISERYANDRINYCIEHTEDGRDVLLGVAPPNASTVRYNQLRDLLEKHEYQDCTYSNGVVRSVHVPRVGNGAFKLNGDEFRNQYVIDTPIDGYRNPELYIALIRLVCSNGAIGYAPSFRSKVVTGKKDNDIGFALERAMDEFNNEEGYSAIRDRYETSAKSWVSVNEVQRLYRLLMDLSGHGDLKKTGYEYVRTETGVERIASSLPIFDAFNKLTGDLTQLYGLTSLDSLSIKRQRTLPVPCKMYDLLNFASEVGTHYANEHGNRKLQAFIGDMICSEYDMENTVDGFSDWRDLFIGNEATAATMKAIKDKNKE